MSERIESQAITTTKNTHHFYCDDCGKYLGCTKEYEDGYCFIIGEFSFSVHIPSRGWRKFNKQFCDDCREKFLSVLDDKLDDLGFKPGTPFGAVVAENATASKEG